MKHLSILFSFFLLNVNAQNLIIDTTFGQMGVSLLQPLTLNGMAYSCKKQSDGKILVAGDDGNYSFLHRFEKNGQPDMTFGASGSVVNTQMEFVNSSENIIIQPDGKILVLGRSYLNGQPTFCLARYNSSGTLDTGFGTNGIKVIDLDPNYPETCAAFCLQSDGKIILAGDSQINSATGDFQLIRLNANGSIDNSYGNNGVVYIDVNNETNLAESVAIFPDNKIAVIGWAVNYSTLNFKCAIAKLNTDGSLDTSFDGDGKMIVSENFISVTAPYNSIVLSDGKLLVSHSLAYNGDAVFSVMRINQNGGLDSSFGNSGIKTLDPAVGSNTNLLYAMALGANDKIVMTGRSDQSTQPWMVSGVGQLTSTGQVDVTFDSDGRKTLAFDSENSFGTDIMYVAEDTLIIVGYTYSQGGYISRLILSDLANQTELTQVLSSISIHPNPSTEIIHIDLNTPETVSLNVIDNLGRTVIPSTTFSGEIQLNVTSLPSGVYYVHLQGVSSTMTEPFYKQ